MRPTTLAFLLVILSNLLFAQKEPLFEYEVYLDNKLINPETFKLSLADTSKILTVGVKPTDYLKASLPEGISWKVSFSEVGVTYGKEVLRSEYVTTPKPIKLLVTLQNYLNTKRYVDENMKPQMIVSFNGVIGTNKSGIEKNFKYFSVIRIDYER